MVTGMGKHWGHGFGANAWGVGFALRNARRATRMHKRVHRGENIRHTDYKAEVSETAGEIFRHLEGCDEATLTELRDGTKHKGTTFMAALGWLMREDKVEVASMGNQVTVKLKA
jgi:hypothetical protein